MSHLIKAFFFKNELNFFRYYYQNITSYKMLGDNVDFEIWSAVDDSWNKIKKIPNYAEVAGEILFRKYVE
jgi:hypothetical protein